jgi:hypothetical protein
MANEKRRVKQYSLDGIEIATFETLSEAAEKTGTLLCSIVNCCRGKQKTANGFIWSYDNSNQKLKTDPLDKLLDFL